MANRAQGLPMQTCQAEGFYPVPQEWKSFAEGSLLTTILIRALKWNTRESYRNHHFLLCVSNTTCWQLSLLLWTYWCIFCQTISGCCVYRFACTFTAWHCGLCSSPGSEAGAEAAETLLMARTEGKCLSIRGNLDEQVVILWLKLVLGNRKWCPLGDFTASGLLSLFAVNLKPKFILLHGHIYKNGTFSRNYICFFFPPSCQTALSEAFAWQVPLISSNWFQLCEFQW